MHKVVVEMEYDTGYRTWSAPMVESEVAAYLDSFSEDVMLSDVDCWAYCPDESHEWSDSERAAEIADAEAQQDHDAYWTDMEQGRYDDDPNPYHGDYSEM